MGRTLALAGCWALGLGVGACGTADDPGLLPTRVDSAGVTIITSGSPAAEWSVAAEPELSLGGLDGGAAEFFGVAAVQFLSGDRFVVANRGSEELRFFTTSGEFVGSVGGAGHGPKEFEGLTWLALWRDSLLTYDWGNDRISVRDRAGSFARAFRLDWASGIIVPVAVLADGSLLSITVRHMTEIEESGTILERALVSRHDRSGRLIDSIGRFPFGQRVVHREGNLQTTIGLPVGATGSLVASAPGFCYAFGVHFELQCFDPSGALRLIHRVRAPPRVLEPTSVERLFEHEVAGAREARNDARVRALLRARSSMEFPSHLPAFVGLRADDRQRVWARKFSLPGESDVEWWVFSEEGWIGRVELDPAFHLMDISGSRLLGVWRDSLGVEEVRIYELEIA